jgi:hypothetical protein
MQLSRDLAESWLRGFMFQNEKDSEKPKTIADYFAVRSNTLSHNRPVLVQKCIDLGLKVVDLRKEEHSELSRRLWELWCLYELHLERTAVSKLYENAHGCSLQKQAATQLQIQAGPPQPLQRRPQPQP